MLSLLFLALEWSHPLHCKTAFLLQLASTPTIPTISTIAGKFQRPTHVSPVNKVLPVQAPNPTTVQASKAWLPLWCLTGLPVFDHNTGTVPERNTKTIAEIQSVIPRGLLRVLS